MTERRLRILVVGGGGREHALAWKCAASERVAQVIVAPGNAGTAAEPRCVNAPVPADDVEALLALALERNVDLTVVGPEAPLVHGLVDRFQARGLRVFGPCASAARLEGSKDFSKAFLERNAIPTADYASFTDLSRAEAYVREHGAPVVVKADGLAAGKGVTVAQDVDSALEAVRQCLDAKSFGEAGARVVVESFLQGEEASFICVVAGREVLALASSQDHKARDDGDRGPNTGGMGAYSPAPVVDEAMHRRIMEQVILPTVNGLAAESIPYLGFLYAGLMIGADGVPRVLEFNCRLGDPETQPLLMRLDSDLVALFEAAIDGALSTHRASWDPRAALGVVLAAGGYPLGYRSGDAISGLQRDAADTKVFHAGTRVEGGQVVTAGGRVLCVCALGEDVAAAQRKAYARTATLGFNGMQFRRDIGHRALARSR